MESQLQNEYQIQIQEASYEQLKNTINPGQIQIVPLPKKKHSCKLATQIEQLKSIIKGM